MSSTGLSLLFVICLAIVFAPRRVAVLAFFLSILCFHNFCKIELGFLQLAAWRISFAAVFIRIGLTKEHLPGGLIKTDKFMILYAITAMITGTLLESNFKGFINRSGMAFDIIGLYFFFRFLINSTSELRSSIVVLAMLMIPLSVLLLVEKTKGINLFSFLSSNPLEINIRDGNIRASGPFEHPILAGTFCATSFPFMVYLWYNGRPYKLLSVFGTLAIMAGVYATASSGPIMSFLFCLLGFAVFPFRHNMKIIRRLIILGLIALQVVMKAPIWFIISKIDLTGSSTGWHRAALFDSCLRHFNEWWFIGTKYTRHWMPTGIPSDPNQTDITNQYIAIGVEGGLFLVIIFVIIQVQCFKNVGRLTFALDDNGPMNSKILPWSFGVAAFSQVCTFFSISFFDQTVMLVYFVFAIITFLSTQTTLKLNKIC